MEVFNNMNLERISYKDGKFYEEAEQKTVIKDDIFTIVFDWGIERKEIKTDYIIKLFVGKYMVFCFENKCSIFEKQNDGYYRMEDKNEN